MLVFVASFFVGVASLLGIVYPFRPFRTRKRAAVSLFVSLIAFVLSPVLFSESFPSPERPALGAGSQLAAVQQQPIEGAAPSNPAVQSTVKSAESPAPALQVPRTVSEEDAATMMSQIDNLEFWPVKYKIEQYIRNGYEVNALLDLVEEKALAAVRPLPASDIEGNLNGYKLLAAVRPEVQGYADKVREYEQRQEDARMAAVRKLNTEVDKVEGVTWYKHPNQPRYLNSRSTVYLYIGRRDQGRPWLRMKVQYAADDWLFVDSVDAWHDGIKEPLVTGYFERDNNTSIWEWVDVSPQDYQLLVLESLANADEAILRFNGQQYRRDVTLSSADKRALREVLEAYEVMSGK